MLCRLFCGNGTYHPATTEGAGTKGALPAIDIDALIARVQVPDEPDMAEADTAGSTQEGGVESDAPTGNGIAAVAVRLTAEGKPVRLEFQEGTSSKFWEVRCDGSCLVVRYGRIGTAGQSKGEIHPSLETALAEGSRRIRQKIAKGYRPVQ